MFERSVSVPLSYCRDQRISFYQNSVNFIDTTQTSTPYNKLAFSFPDKWFKFQLCNKARGWFLVFESRMRTMISTASLPFASIECSTVVSEIRFISAIGYYQKPQTERSHFDANIFIHIMHLGLNATISLYQRRR